MNKLPLSVTRAISVIEKLPGIGPKSATRLVFYLLNTPNEFVSGLAQSLIDLKKNTLVCRECFSVSDEETCSVCRDIKRKKEVICVVERSIDMMNIEKASVFDGVYHVLGGVINPLEHTGPDDLKIDELVERVSKLVEAGLEVELILATGLTMEGEATALYIKNRLAKIKGAEEKIKISRIGSGLPMGASLEYADQATLSRALEGRRGY